MKFTRDLKTEDERHVREGLSEDELELYDLLSQDGLTKDETQKVKLAARHCCIACWKKVRRCWCRTGSRIARPRRRYAMP